MKVLVLGKGGKEHALCHTLQRQGHQVFCLPANGRKNQYVKNHTPNDFQSICQYVKERGIDLTIASSVDILASGIKDYFEKQNLLLFGPNKEASILGVSRSWAKQFMHEENIPTARFSICKTLKEAKYALDNLFVKGKGVILKPGKITSGEWVMICDTYSQALFALDIMKEKYFKDSSDPIIIEERLFGKELTMMAFCDGKKASVMLSVQDYKRLFKDDKGPSTDGIGAYAPLNFLSVKDHNFIQTYIFNRTLEGLIRRNIVFHGILYAGLILTESGVKVLEFNCRFGDPEAQTVLPLLKTDLTKIMVECCHNNLSQKIEFSPLHSCCIVAASKGYPKTFQSGNRITGIKHVEEDPNSFVFREATAKIDNDQLVTTGGRILSIVSIDDTIQLARKRAYEQIKKIHFKGVYYREDIAEKAAFEGYE